MFMRISSEMENLEGGVCLRSLSEEQIKRIPTAGMTICYNEPGALYRNGMCRSEVEKRGCYRIISDSHPLFLIVDEFRSVTSTRRGSLYKADFASGFSAFKEVDKPFYAVGAGALTWEEMSIVNFN